MRILLATIVLTGAALLAYSLFPTQRICREHEICRYGWKILGGLILCFIAGYVVYAVALLQGQLGATSTLVSSILLGGGVFVVLVLRLILRSIQQIKHFSSRERHRAMHDELTELPNRHSMQDHLDAALVQARCNGTPVAIILIDLNRFKEINDALGHFYGDYVLQQVALRLRRVVGDNDILSRCGGDEFTIVLPKANLGAAVDLARRITREIEHPYQIEGHSLTVSGSIGITVFPEHGDDSEMLIHHADVAMYESKRSETAFAVYNPGQDRFAWNRLVFFGELREGLARDQLELHYQPKLSFRNQQLHGIEVLTRWRHPQHGLVLPNDFIPLAEQGGLINALTEQVLDKALVQTAEWSRQGYRFTICVNLSVKNLHDLDFPDKVAELLKRHSVEPSRLVLEITETTMMADPERVGAVVDRLVKLGVGMSIDDYGTGYSSLAYLREFPANEVKIDKSYIIGMLRDKGNASIVRSTIDMAHTIGRKVVAEGVEDIETLRYLEGLNCDYVQGFHICKPLSGADFQEWLERQSGWGERLPA